MYNEPASRGLGDIIGTLGPIQATAGTTMSQLCADTVFRLTHPAQCGGATPAPLPTPTIATPTPAPQPLTFLPGSPLPPPDPTPIVQTFNVPGISPSLNTTPGSNTTYSLVGGTPETMFQPATPGFSFTGGTESKGFGLVEAAIAAALAFLIAQSYKKKKR